jgi:hypothetical protein
MPFYVAHKGLLLRCAACVEGFRFTPHPRYAVSPQGAIAVTAFFQLWGSFSGVQNNFYFHVYKLVMRCFGLLTAGMLSVNATLSELILPFQFMPAIGKLLLAIKV